MKGEARSHPLFPLMPLLPHFITTVGIPSFAICITAEQGATWPGVLGWDVHTHLVALNTAPEIKKQLCPIMNQPNLLFPLNPSTPARPCCTMQRGKAAVLVAEFSSTQDRPPPTQHYWDGSTSLLTPGTHYGMLQ